MICTGTTTTVQGPCNGDDGAPLVVQGILVGIYTWSGQCGAPNYPSVYSNVFHFRSFIDENLSYIRN